VDESFDDAYHGHRVLVTGHTGFKGSWLTKWLLDLDAEVAGFSIDIPTDPSLFEMLDLAPRIEDHRGDLRSLEQLRAVCELFRPTVVFHLAAQALVGRGYREPKETFDTNIGGTVNLLEAVRATPSVKAVVIATSDKVYHNDGAGRRFSEDDPLGGHDPYSASKAGAELVFGSYQRLLLTSMASVRAGNVFGGGDFGADRLIPDCIRAWQKGEPVPLRYPKATRPWQHVLDCLSGYLWVGARLLQGDAQVVGQSFNFGPPPESVIPVSQLVDLLSEAWGGCGWTALDGPQAPEAAQLAVNSDKALRLLPWRPHRPLAQAIEETATWYQHEISV
jgi:CDP-glucose 4,6-dehydratase